MFEPDDYEKGIILQMLQCETKASGDAKRSRKYREKLKNTDKRKYYEMLSKARDRSAESRKKAKLEGSSDAEKERIRKLKQNIRSKRYYDKNIKANKVSKNRPQNNYNQKKSPESSNSDEESESTTKENSKKISDLIRKITKKKGKKN